jgi:putative DNA primase/helicase
MRTKQSQFEFSPKGVFRKSNGGRERISGRIRYKAVGTRVADNTKVALITFENLDGEELSETFALADFLPRNRINVLEQLANKGYRWPARKGLTEAILSELTAIPPKRRFLMVGAPGWYDSIYVTPDREYGPKKSKLRSYRIDNKTGASVASLILGTDSLKGWKKNVARAAKRSSIMRLGIAAAFAAPLLRPLGMDSFGLNIFSDTSTGKSSVLFVAASVPGLIGERGLPGWADSQTAIEQLMVGHRDGLVPLDETADGEDKMGLATKARLLAFAIGRNRPRNLDKRHEKNTNLTTRDCRNIVLSSSERALGSIAVAEGHPRLGGEEVRLIDVPATDSTSQGIFDRSANLTIEEAKQTIENLRADAIVHQGVALHKFLRRYTKDANAVEKLKRYRRDFEKKASRVMTQTSDIRICSNFAVIYAAAALAIEYEILPWGKKSTLKAVQKCMAAALQVRLENKNPTTPETDPATVLKRVQEELENLDILAIKKGTKALDAERREQADGFRSGTEVLVKPDRWKSRIIAVNKTVLLKHKVLRTERADTMTVARKVSGITGKLRYIVIDMLALDEAITSGEKSTSA